MEKNSEDCLVVLNKIARSIIEGAIKNYFNHVFTKDGKPFTRILNKGWFPHATRSNRGLKNVVEFVKEGSNAHLNVVYVTRSYLMPHGAEPLPHELSSQPYKRVLDKTNITNSYKGSLRYA